MQYTCPTVCCSTCAAQFAVTTKQTQPHPNHSSHQRAPAWGSSAAHQHAALNNPCKLASRTEQNRLNQLNHLPHTPHTPVPCCLHLTNTRPMHSAAHLTPCSLPSFMRSMPLLGGGAAHCPAAFNTPLSQDSAPKPALSRISPETRPVSHQPRNTPSLASAPKPALSRISPALPLPQSAPLRDPTARTTTLRYIRQSVRV